MRSEQRLVWLAMMAILLAGTGCCCVQGMQGGCGPCGMSGMASCGSCSGGCGAGGGCSGGGCGERYVDEWISDPPTVDACCAGDCRPVRSLLQALWGSRFVNGCDMCGGGCDSGSCDSGGCSSCGYASAGGSGCTSCGGGGMISGGMTHAGGGCSSCGGGGGGVPTEAMMPTASRRMPNHASQLARDGEPQMVPGSYRVSEPRRVNASVASERINPARQKIDAKRASYAGE